MKILNNYVANAGEEGIVLEEATPLEPEISGNVVIGNGSHGLTAGPTNVDSVRRNAFVGNEGDGVRLSTGESFDRSVGAFRENVAMSNDGVGFDVTVDRNCLRNTAVSNGGDGFRVESDGAEVKFNRSTGNGGDGVVLGADDSGITRNRICGNDGEQLVDDGDENRFGNNLVC